MTYFARKFTKTSNNSLSYQISVDSCSSEPGRERAGTPNTLFVRPIWHSNIFDISAENRTTKSGTKTMGLALFKHPGETRESFLGTKAHVPRYKKNVAREKRV